MTDDFTIFFALLGSARAKADHQMLVKTTPLVSALEVEDAV